MVPPAFALIAALFIDRLAGDPRSRVHPVALLGRVIGTWASPGGGLPPVQYLVGAAGCVATLALFTAPFLVVSLFCRGALYLVLAPVLLWACIGWRSLEDHVRAVEASLARGGAGREEAAMLVSRSTAALSPGQVRSAAYESMAENLTDSIVAPLCYFGLLGLAGAALYRAANTMDAMVGYPDHRARIGWCAARLDDVLSWGPARVAGLLLLGYFAVRGRFGPAWETFRRDAHKRPGFNGGIPMAIIAGGVGTAFEKPGSYVIGTPDRSLERAGPEIVRAVRAASVACAILVSLFVLLIPPVFHPLW